MGVTNELRAFGPVVDPLEAPAELEKDAEVVLDPGALM